MGQIIMPGQSAVQDEQEIQISWSQDDVHPEFREDLEVNSKLFPKYVEAVKNAVLRSLRHEDTRPTELTAAILKERVGICHKALYIMRFEMNMSLRHSFDKLGTKLLEALASGQRVEDLVEASRTRITDDGESWRREAEPRAHTLNMDKDFAEGVVPDPDDGDDE